MMKSLQTSAPIQLTVEVKGVTAEVMPCDLLVVACEPRKLEDVCKFKEPELEVFDALVNFTFHTTVVKVPVPADAATKLRYGVVLSTEAIQEMEGTICAFRNETAKQFSLDTANDMTENLVTVYQFQGPRETPWTNEQFLQNLKDTLQELDWWPYASFEICNDAESKPVALCSPYFDHFCKDGVMAHMPWNYLKVQGTLNTLYVHASTCFESVLQCWQYGEFLLDNLPSLGYQLPEDKDASIVILGAGPSGMLFAHRLQGLSYTNVQILESTDRIGGKTHTVYFPAPSPPGPSQETPCELGTCYLSPGYDDMVDELKQFKKGNERHGFWVTADHKNPKGTSFRGMVTKGQFDDVKPLEAAIDYDKYVFLKGYYEANKPFADPENWLDGYSELKVKAEIAVALTAYLGYVEMFLGSSLPMPTKPPQGLIDENYSSFYDMLARQDLLVLTGLFEYAYSVQGYGPLKNIPAYYGMIWMSVPVIKAILESVLPGHDEPGVTVWSKGWQDIWTEMALTLKITTNANVTNINRGP